MEEDRSGNAMERRASQRHVSVLLHAGIAHEGRDGLCRVRNLSSGGVMLESNLLLSVDDPVLLQVKSGHRISGRVRWVRGDTAGIAFDDPAAAAYFTGVPQKMASDIVSPIGYPLFERHCPVRLESGRGHVKVPLLMVSPAGIIVAQPPSWPGEHLYAIYIEGMAMQKARVGERMMTSDGEVLALLFTQPLHYRLLNDWLTGAGAGGEDSAAS